MNNASTTARSGAVVFRGLLQAEFGALDLVIYDTFHALTQLQAGSESEVTRLAVGQRALTTLQGSRLMLEEGHWELAACAARQLFEVLVNVEHLLNRSDTEVAWENYRGYGEAQSLQASLRKLSYAVALGYNDTQGEVEALTKALGDARFDEFRHPKGHIRDSWSGLSVEKLAKASLVPRRVDQYRYYYRTWSEQAHGSPSSLIGTITPRAASTGLNEELASYAHEARQLITMLVGLAADLGSALGIFGLNCETTVRGWREQLSREAPR